MEKGGHSPGQNIWRSLSFHLGPLALELWPERKRVTHQSLSCTLAQGRKDKENLRPVLNSFWANVLVENAGSITAREHGGNFLNFSCTNTILASWTNIYIISMPERRIIRLVNHKSLPMRIWCKTVAFLQLLETFTKVWDLVGSDWWHITRSTVSKLRW